MHFKQILPVELIAARVMFDDDINILACPDKKTELCFCRLVFVLFLFLYLTVNNHKSGIVFMYSLHI